MRIGLVTTSYPRFPGDLAGGFVAEHAAFLVRAGHDVEVIAADGPGLAASREGSTGGGRAARDRSTAWRAGDGPRVRWVPAPAGLFDRGGAPEALAGGGRSYLAAARFSVALAREVRRRAPAWDAVVAHWLVPGALAAVAAARRLPLLAIAHSGDVHLLRRLRLTGAVGALLSRPGVRISFVTDELRRIFVAGAPGCTAPMQVCSMGVDVARLRDARRDVARDGDRPPAVLFLGRLVPVKGVDVLIRAAALWRCPARRWSPAPARSSATCAPSPKRSPPAGSTSSARSAASNAIAPWARPTWSRSPRSGSRADAAKASRWSPSRRSPREPGWSRQRSAG